MELLLGITAPISVIATAGFFITRRKLAKLRSECEEAKKVIESVSNLFNSGIVDNYSYSGDDDVLNSIALDIQCLLKEMGDEYLDIQKEIDAKMRNYQLKRAFNIKDRTITVSFVGKFSAGKSSLINSVFNKKILPENIVPSTAVPTIIVNSDKDRYLFIDFENNLREVKPELLDFIEHEKSASIPVNYMIKSVAVFTKTGYDDIIFIDTPGYNSGNIMDIIKMSSIVEISDVVFVVVDINDGVLTADLINLLSRLKDKLIYIVINKVDLKPPSEIEEITSYILNQVDSAEDIKIQKILHYSSVEDTDLYRREFVNELNSIRKRIEPESFYGYIQKKIEFLKAAVNDRNYHIAKYIRENQYILDNIRANKSFYEKYFASEFLYRKVEKVAKTIEKR